jgi:hypothetical protein
MTSKLQQLAVELERELNSRINEELIVPPLEKHLIDRGYMLPEQAGNSLHVRDAIYNIVDMVDQLRSETTAMSKDRDYWRQRYHDEVYGPEPEQQEGQPEGQAAEAFDEPPMPEPVEAPFFRVDTDNGIFAGGNGNTFTGDALADLFQERNNRVQRAVDERLWRDAMGDAIGEPTNTITGQL